MEGNRYEAPWDEFLRKGEASNPNRRQEEGANQKRGLSRTAGRPMLDLAQNFNIEDKTRSSGTNSTTRPSAAGLEQEICLSQKRLLHSSNRNRGQPCPQRREHETLANKMPGSSSGSQPPPSPELLSSSPSIPSREHRFGGDSTEEPEENEGKVLSAKRVPPSVKSQPAKQHSSVVDLNGPGINPSVVDLLEDDGEGRHKKVQQDEEKKPKGGKLRKLWDNSSTISRDPGPHPGVNYRRESQMSSSLKNGAFKPHNTLNKERFNLHEEHPRRTDNPPPSKRQKTHDALKPRNPLSAHAVEVETGLGQSHLGRRPSTAPSGFSQPYNEPGQNGMPRGEVSGRVGEYVGLTSKLNPRKVRPPRRSSDNQHQSQGGSRQFKQQTSGGINNNVENPEDPIVDELSTIETTAKSNKSPRIEIAAYQGTANRHPPREKPNTQRQRRFGPEVSDHFPNKESRQKPNSKDLNAGSGRVISSKLSESDGEIDPLSEEHFQTANKCLKASQREVLAKHPFPTRGHKHDGEITHHFSLSSSTDEDEDESNARAKIHPSKLLNVKQKSKNPSGEEKCDVRMVFSEKQLWLVENRDARWSLVFNKSGSCLTLLDDDGQLQWTLPSNNVSKFEYASGSAMVVLHTLRDMHGQMGVNIHLKLGDIDQVETLKEHLGCASSTMSHREHSTGQLKKIFSNTLKNTQDAINKKRDRSDEVEADDVKLLASNQARRYHEKQEKSKREVQEMFQRASDASKPHSRSEPVPRESRRVAESMRPIALEEQQEHRKPSTIESRGFYSPLDKQSNAHLSTRSSTRASARELAPRPPAKSPSPDLSLERWTRQNPDWENKWKSSLLFPREGKDKATVDMQDIERLDEGEFLNDNLLIFYLRYLEADLQKNNPDLAKRVYFQNTFFYTRLTKNPSKGKRINYEAVERWTAKVDLLDFDYIIVPVNENNHWYVAIICNVNNLIVPDPQEVANFPSPGLTRLESSISKPDYDEKFPLPHVVSSGMEGMSIEDRLPAESKQKGGNDSANNTPHPLPESDQESKKHVQAGGFGGTSDDVDEVHEVPITSDFIQSPKTTPASTPVEKGRGKGKRRSLPNRKVNLSAPRIITLDSLGIAHSVTCTNLRDYLVAEIRTKKALDVEPPAKIGHTVKIIPQQDNYCDCGLFLLMYIEMFLKKGDDFIHSLIQNSEDLTLEWPKASELRSKIRNLLFKLQEEQVIENARARETKSKVKRTPKAEGKTIAVKDPVSSETIGEAVPKRAIERQTQAPQDNISKVKKAVSGPDQTVLEDQKGLSTVAVVLPAVSTASPPHEVITLDESQERLDIQDTAPPAPPAAIPPQTNNRGRFSFIKTFLGRATSSSQAEPLANGRQPEDSPVASSPRMKERRKNLESVRHKDPQTRKSVREIQESPGPSTQLHDETPQGVVDNISPRREKSRIPNQNTRQIRSPTRDQRGGPDNAIDLEEPVDLLMHVESADQVPREANHQRSDDDEEMLLYSDVEGRGGPDDPLLLSDSSPVTVKGSRGRTISAVAQPSPSKYVNQQRKDRGTRPAFPVNGGSTRGNFDSPSSIPSKRKSVTEMGDERGSRVPKPIYNALDSSDHAILGKRARHT